MDKLLEWVIKSSVTVKTWHCHGMQHLPQVRLWNFCLTRSVLVNCKLYYCEVEKPRRNNNSVMDYIGTQIVYHLLQHSQQTTKLPLEGTSAQELRPGSLMIWVFMAEQLALPADACWSSVKHSAAGLWSSGNWSDESGMAVWWTNLHLADARRTLHTKMHSAYCKSSVEGGHNVDLYLLSPAIRSLISSGRMTRCSPMSLWFPNTHTGTWVGTLGSSLRM